MCSITGLRRLIRVSRRDGAYIKKAAVVSPGEHRVMMRDRSIKKNGAAHKGDAVFGWIGR